jgi:glycine betaine catabolism B
MQVTLDTIDTHSPEIRTFWFIPERMPDYTAGQFIELTLPGVPAGERERRWFTLSSSPHEDRLAITTTINPKSAFKRTLAGLKPKDIAIMSEPMGDFVLPIQSQTPILFVVGGMGITPVRSMVKWLLDKGEKRPIHVVYAARQPHELLFGDLLTQYGLTPSYLLSAPHPDWQGEVDKLDSERILRHYTPGGLIYISGPELMTERLVYELKESGIAAAKLVTDYFPGYPAV